MIKNVYEKLDFGVDLKDVDEMNTLVLAYVGDVVYELYVRTFVVSTFDGKVNNIHKTSVNYVKASNQALGLSCIEADLSEDEKGLVRRGRNNKNLSVPKNGNRKDYRDATGLEALLGYLYLSKDNDRLEEIIMTVLKFLRRNFEEVENG